jgi:hypothetical protein
VEVLACWVLVTTWTRDELDALTFLIRSAYGSAVRSDVAACGSCCEWPVLKRVLLLSSAVWNQARKHYLRVVAALIRD